MASKLPPVKGSAYTFHFYGLEDQGSAGLVKRTPTLAAGDVKVSTDGGAVANADTLPDEHPANSGIIRVQLSEDEMDGDEIVVTFCDASGDEWYDKGFTLHPAAQTFDTIDSNVDDILADTSTDGVALADDAITSDALDASGLSSIAVEVADAVWDETLATHSGVGSTGLALTDMAESVWTYATRTLTAFGTLVADIWAYATRTLTQSAASVAETVDSGAVTITRGDDLSLSLTDLGSIAGHADVWFSVKAELDDADSEAILVVSETVGLEVINGEAGTAGNATLTVDDAASGDITVTVAAVETAKLVPGKRHYDVQWLDGSGLIHTLSLGVSECTIQGDVTRATS